MVRRSVSFNPSNILLATSNFIKRMQELSSPTEMHFKPECPSPQMSPSLHARRYRCPHRMVVPARSIQVAASTMRYFGVDKKPPMLSRVHHIHGEPRLADARSQDCHGGHQGPGSRVRAGTIAKPGVSFACVCFNVPPGPLNPLFRSHPSANSKVPPPLPPMTHRDM